MAVHVLKYKVGEKQRELKIFQLKHMNMTPNGNEAMPPTAQLYKSGTELTKRMSAEECEYCDNSNMPMEVHHVRKMKDLTSKPNKEIWERQMIAKNRKTLVLCKECHHLLHQGTLPDIRRTN